MSAPEKFHWVEDGKGYEYIRSDLYEKAIAECERHEEAVEYLLKVVQAAYRKHHLDDYSIGWDELSEMMLNVLCNIMGDKEFNEWLSKQKEAV